MNTNKCSICDNILRIKEGNYFWDNNSKALIRYSSNIVEIDCPNEDSIVHVAFPIPLNEDVLEAVGFTSNQNCKYTNGDNSIIIDGVNSNGVLVYDNIPIIYLSDLQNIIEHVGKTLEIDIKKLEQACKNSI